MRTTTILSVSLAALLAISPAALAGTPEDPEVTDAALDAGPANVWGDIEKAWIEQIDEKTLRVSMQFTLLSPSRPGVVNAIIFDAGGRTHYAAYVHAEEGFFATGAFDRATMREQSADDAEGTFEAGPQGLVTVDVPIVRLGRNATALTDIAVFTADIGTALVGGDYLILDEAPASRDFTLTAPKTAPDQASAPTEPPEEQAVAPAATGKEDQAPPSPTRETPAPTLLVVLVALAALALVRRR